MDNKEVSYLEKLLLHLGKKCQTFEEKVFVESENS